MRLLRTIGVTAGLAACVVTASCTNGEDAKPEKPRANAVAPSPSQSLDTEVVLPPAELDLTTLATVPPTSGGKPAGAVAVKPGTFWLTIHCRGGKLTVLFQPVGELTLPCALDSVTPSKNQIEVSQHHQVPIRVEASQDVRWSLRVEQGGFGTPPPE